jgi:pantoate kinase
VDALALDRELGAVRLDGNDAEDTRPAAEPAAVVGRKETVGTAVEAPVPLGRGIGAGGDRNPAPIFAFASVSDRSVSEASRTIASVQPT